MAQTKYRQYYQDMVTHNQKLFTDFKVVHDQYVAKEIDQQKYNATGMRIVDIIRDWDRRLCSAMGRGAFSKYSEQLSEKFWSEVRKEYSHIDKVGLK